jgi:hypothetical protein
MFEKVLALLAIFGALIIAGKVAERIGERTYLKRRERAIRKQYGYGDAE